MSAPKELKICSNKLTTLVDEDVFVWASKKRWFLKDSGYVFRWTTVDGKRKMSLLHKEIMGNYQLDIDHKNRNKLDNTRNNLRLCTRSENLANKPKKRGECSSKFKGVSWIPSRKRWKARFICKAKKISKSMNFKNELDAAKQYNLWAIAVFGEFACINEVSL